MLPSIYSSFLSFISWYYHFPSLILLSLIFQNISTNSLMKPWSQLMSLSNLKLFLFPLMVLWESETILCHQKYKKKWNILWLQVRKYYSIRDEKVKSNMFVQNSGKLSNKLVNLVLFISFLFFLSFYLAQIIRHFPNASKLLGNIFNSRTHKQNVPLYIILHLFSFFFLLSFPLSFFLSLSDSLSLSIR